MNDSDLIADDPRRSEREELVAYLDGELPEEACREVERRLAGDEEYRRHMQQLARAWDALDQLQRVTVGETFAHSTVEMVAVAAAEDAQQQRQAVPRRRRLEWVVGLVAILLTAGVGYAIVSSRAPRENERIVEDLPVLENLDAYQQVGDAEFLRLVQEANLFPASEEEEEGQQTEEPASWIVITSGADDAPAARRGRVESMTPAEKADLQRRKERFEKLPSPRQEQLRRLHDDLAADPQREQLAALLHRYDRWLGTLTAKQRAELRELAPPERLVLVQQFLDQQEAQQIQRLAELSQGLRFSRDELKSLMQWMDEYVKRHEQELIAAISLDELPKRFREFLTNKDDDSTRRRTTLFAVWHRSAGTDRRLAMSTEEWDELLKILPEEARNRLRQVSAMDRKLSLLQNWIDATIFSSPWRGSPRGWSPPPVTQEQLQAFFQKELTDEQREELLKKPADEMQRMLLGMYYQKRFRWHGNPWDRDRRRDRGNDDRDRDRDDRDRDENDRPRRGQGGRPSGERPSPAGPRSEGQRPEDPLRDGTSPDEDPSPQENRPEGPPPEER